MTTSAATRARSPRLSAPRAGELGGPLGDHQRRGDLPIAVAGRQQTGGPASSSPLVELLPEHTAPELLYLESKWASLVPYGLTFRALRDFLPVDARLNATTVRRDTLRVARRLDAELGPEPIFPLTGCTDACAKLPAPPPPPPIAVGLDGGYLALAAPLSEGSCLRLADSERAPPVRFRATVADCHL